MYLVHLSGFITQLRSAKSYASHLERAMAPHSSTLAWKIPWTEEPGRLQFMGSLRVGHDWATSLSLFTFMHWRRKWQPTPVLLPGESHGGRSLVGYSLWLQSMGTTVGKSMTRLSNFTSLYFRFRYLLLPLGIFLCFHLFSHLKNGKNKISFLEVYYSVQIRWHIW